MNAIDIKDLKFSYGAHPILDLPELQIQSGEIVFLYGPSGSGKSTLLELLAGVLQGTGKLKVGDRDLTQLSISELDHYRAESIGYIFQSFNLIPYLSVLENIELPFLFKRGEHTQKELEDLLSALGLTNYIDRKISQLSVGQQQRVAVARALIKRPKIILADEPTSALDYNHREKFLRILFALCRLHKTTVVFVSHDLTIEKLFDRSVSLAQLNRVQNVSVEQV